ncbi:hypothetical protein HPB50_020316 [Hyalomma asiaticum]|uniref:Uncharacterized protein n=1 Tax=Hyalomma asiaticum TaxID=266040 RepID=A0ACB7RNE5_HYAAI|nr:hypothetical protein HPB50_020316 [Hyalomma asiaticum]
MTLVRIWSMAVSIIDFILEVKRSSIAERVATRAGEGSASLSIASEFCGLGVDANFDSKF